MSKQDPYRFNLKFDSPDEEHRQVCDFLNACGRKKARYIVKAVLAYWGRNGGMAVPEDYEPTAGRISEEAPGSRQEEQSESSKHFVSVAAEEYSADHAEVELMKKNYEMFADLGKET